MYYNTSPVTRSESNRACLRCGRLQAWLSSWQIYSHYLIQNTSTWTRTSSHKPCLKNWRQAESPGERSTLWVWCPIQRGVKHVLDAIFNVFAWHNVKGLFLKRQDTAKNDRELSCELEAGVWCHYHKNNKPIKSDYKSCLSRSHLWLCRYTGYNHLHHNAERFVLRCFYTASGSIHIKITINTRTQTLHADISFAFG